MWPQIVIFILFALLFGIIVQFIYLIALDIKRKNALQTTTESIKYTIKDQAHVEAILKLWDTYEHDKKNKRYNKHKLWEQISLSVGGLDFRKNWEIVSYVGPFIEIAEVEKKIRV